MRKSVHIEKLPSGAYSVRHWGPCPCVDHDKKTEPFFYREWRENYEEAKLRANLLESRLLAFKQNLPDTTVKPIDIYTRYIEAISHTHRSRTIDLKNDHAKPFFASSQHITVGRIKEYKAEQLKKVGISTVSIRLREIRAVCNWAKKEGYLTENLFENVEIPPAKESGAKLAMELIKQIWDNSDECFKPFLSFLIFTGARHSEILLTQWKHLNLDRGIWHIPAENCKTKKERYVPLAPQLIKVLQEQTRRGNLIFEGWVDNTPRWYLNKACAKLQIKMKFEGKDFPESEWPSPHTFRHTFASHWRGDIRDLMDFCGWTTMLMPKRYTHNNTEDLRKEAEQKGIAASLELNPPVVLKEVI